MSDQPTIVVHKHEHPTTMVHDHQLSFRKREDKPGGIFRILAAPLLLAAAVFTVIKTEGEYKEINWLVPAFGFLCIWKNV